MLYFPTAAVLPIQGCRIQGTGIKYFLVSEHLNSNSKCKYVFFDTLACDIYTKCGWNGISVFKLFVAVGKNLTSCLCQVLLLTFY